MTRGHRPEATRRQLLRDALVTVAAVLLAFAAFDDITTGTDTNFTFEWAGLAVCAGALLSVCWRLVRREQWWLASISGVVLTGAVGAGALVRPGVHAFRIEYLMIVAGYFWFLVLAAILTSRALRQADALAP